MTVSHRESPRKTPIGRRSLHVRCTAIFRGRPARASELTRCVDVHPTTGRYLLDMDSETTSTIARRARMVGPGDDDEGIDIDQAEMESIRNGEKGELITRDKPNPR